jgi:hypothetical protein
MNNLIEGKDYYFNAEGLMVFTSTYHIKKGKCCGNGCKHCPYEYENVSSLNRDTLLKERPPIIFNGIKNN